MSYIQYSPAFLGTPTAPTAAASTSTTQIATTAFVLGQAGTSTPAMNGTGTVGTSVFWSRQDHVHPTDTSRAPLASPTLTGVPAAPTAASDTSTTQIATTAFVVNQAGSATPLINGTAAVGTSARYSRQDHVHPTDSTRAPLASPALTGVPTAPTAAAGNNSTQVATTAYLDSKLGAASGIATLDASGKLTTGQIPAALVGAMQYQGTWNASTNSPALAAGTGTKGQYYKVSVAGTTSIDGVAQWNVGDLICFDGTTWDKIEGQAVEVLSVAGRTGAVTLAVADVSGAAPLASPALTGTPTAPTAAADTNSTQLATTAFVVAQASASTPAMNGTAAVGTSLKYARADHVHGSDTTKAPLASPTFTGVPAVPTAGAGTNTTQAASTAFVAAAVAASALADAGQGVALKTSAYSIVATDQVILADASAGGFTITLPSAAVTQRFTIKKVDATTNAVTVATVSSQLIDGVSSVSINGPMNALTFQAYNGVWYLI